MIPHQIFCDYLEDKGIDCRLLRTQESGGIHVTDPHVVNYVDAEGYGAGEYHGFGWVSGDGMGFGFLSNELYNSGFAYCTSYGHIDGDGYGCYILNGDGNAPVNGNWITLTGGGRGDGFYLK